MEHGTPGHEVVWRVRAQRRLRILFANGQPGCEVRLAVCNVGGGLDQRESSEYFLGLKPVTLDESGRASLFVTPSNATATMLGKKQQRNEKNTKHRLVLVQKESGSVRLPLLFQVEGRKRNASVCLKAITVGNMPSCFACALTATVQMWRHSWLNLTLWSPLSKPCLMQCCLTGPTWETPTVRC